jgi:hypothetical protein
VEGQVREKLQAALQVKDERERTLADARAGPPSTHRRGCAASRNRELSVEQTSNRLREKITEVALKGAGSRHPRRASTPSSSGSRASRAG